MANVAQVEQSLKHILEERANVLARETGCIERQRKFSGADLLQLLVFGWLSHPDASLEMLASMATLREIKVTDTAVHKRFTQACAHFLHAILEEMTSVVVEADRQVPLELVNRFEAIVLARQQYCRAAQRTGYLLARLWRSAWRRSRSGPASMCAGNESEGVCRGQSLHTDAQVIDRVLSKRNRCPLAVSPSLIWATWTGQALPLGEQPAVTR
jgi:hypothetical protein